MRARDYLQLFWRRKLVIIVPVVIVTAIVIVYSLFYNAPQYQATAEILRRQTGIEKILLGSSLFEQSISVTDRALQDDSRLLTAQEVVEAVENRLADKLPKAGAGFQIEAEPVKQTNILRIKATNADPALAADIANSFAEEYIQWQKKVKNNVIARARASIESKVAAVPPDQNKPDNHQLTNKLQALKLIEAMQISDLQIVRTAAPPPQPVSSSLFRFPAIALLVGLFSGMGLVFVLESFDTKIRSTIEITKNTNMPVLGIIPYALQNNGKLIKDADYNCSSAEAYRLIKTNLSLSLPDKEIKTILITSPGPSEGKTTTTANLAVTMARAGQRVIVLEADLRRPRLASYLGLKDNLGLTNALFNNLSLQEAAQQIEVKDITPDVTRDHYQGEIFFKKKKPVGFDAALGSASFSEVKPVSFVTAGPLPPSPGEAISSVRFDALIAEASAHADLVIIDSPPIGAVSDAASLAAKVDGVILVMRLETTTKNSFDLIRNFSASTPCNILGVVVTDATASGSKSYQYGYHGVNGDSTPSSAAHHSGN